jgi:hypothetical protein
MDTSHYYEIKTRVPFLVYAPYFGKIKKFYEELIAYYTDRIENEASNNSLLPRERLYQVVT